jgi:chemotaxis signal transduction protein
MQTISRGQKSKAAKTIPVVIFSVGGRRVAAKAEEVGGIWPWTQPMPVPSGTPFIHAVLRRGDEVMPVFDLAGRLGVQVNATGCLCLIAKRLDGPMAVCIDGDIPTLQVLHQESISPVKDVDADIAGSCRIGDQETPIYSLAHLGLSPP